MALWQIRMDKNFVYVYLYRKVLQAIAHHNLFEWFTTTTVADTSFFRLIFILSQYHFDSLLSDKDFQRFIITKMILMRAQRIYTNIWCRRRKSRFQTKIVTGWAKQKVNLMAISSTVRI